MIRERCRDSTTMNVSVARYNMCARLCMLVCNVHCKICTVLLCYITCCVFNGVTNHNGTMAACLHGGVRNAPTGNRGST